MASSGPLKTIIDSFNKKQGKSAKPTERMSEDIAMEIEGSGGGDAIPIPNKNKRLSVERIYQKKTQLEHILLRPDTYIGSVEKVTQSMWVMDDESNMMVQRDITYVPGLYKIFDEILVNAADNKQRDPTMNAIKIEIDPENNKLKIWNNGKGIPVIEHKDENMFVPTMIFGHLLTSSNYDDSQKKVTGGRNGYGAKLCNIFSKKFIVETSCKEYNKAFKQTWGENMTKTKEPTITPCKGDDFTAITFHPDLSKFKMETLDKDAVDLFTRRAYDIAAASRGVKVFLNGKRLPVKNFRDYIDLYIKDKTDDNGVPLKVVYEKVNDRWEVGLTLSDKGFQQASFVNSIATTKGGRHVDYVTEQVTSKLIEVVKKKNKGGVNIKPFQIKSHIWVFVNCLIENPTFDSQTKENMTLQPKSFGSKCQLTQQFMNQAVKCGIIEGILTWMRFKAQTQLQKKCHGSKHSKLKGIPKLDDANEAGTKNSLGCTLILTEGDSAKSLAVAGLGVIGRDKYGVFPLRGKVLNVREATHKQIMENAEINNLIKIMGLQFKEKYEDRDRLKTLRYGKIMIMTDQDQDGSHIKGLLINFIHHFWPNLLKFNVVEEFITPIVKVSKGKNEMSFYSLPEFEEWKRSTDNWHTWKIKYYKGLGTSTSKEAKDYFSDMNRHRIPFRYSGAEDDASIVLAFSKKKIEERKQWLTNWMEERKSRLEMGLPELYLYGKETKNITYNEFVNRELVLFSNTDNVRSIPSLVDGFKPGQRKVVFTCFKRNDKKEVKVAQLAGSVAELSAYHHGEQSLMGTIINLAQNFVGSNNLNVLQPLGQFGTRIHGGKDAASPRYIFTMLSSLTRILFNVNDDPLLNNLYDDNQKIEPEYYVPIIPMVLVNGAEGIGTGWSTKILNHDIREVVANINRLIEGDEPVPMLPSFKNFKGSINQLVENRYIVSGEISIIDDQTIEITELPIRTWTQNYKEDVLEPMLHGTEKIQPIIQDYKEYHTDTTVKFLIKMTPEKLAQAEQTGLHKVFKIQTSATTGAMVLFDHNGCIRRYDNTMEIMREFYDVRLDLYHKRKAYLEGMLAAESLRLDNIARFILEKIEGKIIVENKRKKDLIQTLLMAGYDSDPVKAWKEAQNKVDTQEEEGEDDDSEASGSSSGPDYNYLLGMPIWNLTREKKDELCKQRDAKSEELEKLRRKTPKGLWKEDLEAFLAELDNVEAKEREDAMDNPTEGKGQKLKGKPKQRKLPMMETKPSPMGRRVDPRIDSAMKEKAAKTAAAAKRGKKTKEVANELKFEDDEDSKQPDLFKFLKKEEKSNEPKSLSERLNLNAKSKPKKISPKSKSKLKGSPKKKKKNVWETSDEEEENSDFDDGDMDGSFISPPAIDRGPRRQAAAKVTKYVESDDDKISSDDDGELQPIQNNGTDHKTAVLSDSDDEFLPASKSGKRKAPGSSDDEDPFERSSRLFDAISPRNNTTAATTNSESVFSSQTSTTSATSVVDLSDSESNPPPAKSKPAAKDKPPAKKPKKAAEPKPKKGQQSIASAFAKASKSKPKAKPKTLVSSDDDDDILIDDASPDIQPKPVSKSRAKKVLDGDLFDRNSDEEKSQPAKASKPKAKPKKSADSDSDDDDMFGAKSKPEKSQPAKASKPKAKPKKSADSDSDDDDMFGAKSKPEKSQPAKASKPKAKPKKSADSDSDDDDMFGAKSKPEKSAKASKPKAKPKPKAKKLADSDEDDDDDMFGAKSKPAPKPRKKKKFSDSESDEEFMPKKKSSAAPSKKKKKADSDEEINMDDEMESIVIPRETTGRARKPAKYTFDDSEDDFSD